MTKTGSLAPLPTYWPADLALHDRAGDRRVDRVAGLIVPFPGIRDLLVALPRMRSRLRTASSPTSAERMSFSAPSSTRGRSALLERDRLAVIERALTLVVDLREIEHRATLLSEVTPR